MLECEHVMRQLQAGGVLGRALTWQQMTMCVADGENLLDAEIVWCGQTCCAAASGWWYPWACADLAAQQEKHI